MYVCWRVEVHCCFTSTETIKTVRDRELKMVTSTSTQLLSSVTAIYTYSLHRSLFIRELGTSTKVVFVAWYQFSSLCMLCRKKTNTWQGTIAGTLSSGCPHQFISGAAELGASGWWKLVEMKPPVFHVGKCLCAAATFVYVRVTPSSSSSSLCSC